MREGGNVLTGEGGNDVSPILYLRKTPNTEDSKSLAIFQIAPPTTVDDTPPEEPPKPPTKGGKGEKSSPAKNPDKPKQQQPPAAIKNLLARICFGKEEGLIATSWARLVKAWNNLDCPSEEAIREFGEKWFRHDWRGKKGQRPTPSQLVSEWNIVTAPAGTAREITAPKQSTAWTNVPDEYFDNLLRQQEETERLKKEGEQP